MKNKFFLVVFAFIFAVGLAVDISVGIAAPNSITLKSVSFVPPMSAKAKLFKEFIKKVEDNAKGELQIKYLGGPEVIGSLEQAEAVKRGVVDMVYTVGGMYTGLVPEAFMLCLSRVSAEEELKRGVIDFLQPLHAKAGLYLLGEIFGSNEGVFMVWTNKKADRPQDLAGQRWGAGAPTFNAIAKAFGADMVVMPMSEAYTALERGLVDAWLFPAGSLVPLGAHEKIKYAIDHPFWAENGVILINPGKWNSLPQNLQKIMQDALREIAPELGRKNLESEEEYRQAAKKAGVEFYKFSPADADFFLDTIYEATWKWQLEKLPETGSQLKRIINP